MTPGAARNVKLGLFAALISAVAVAAAVWLGVAGTRAPVAEYHSFFDNSVQGLDVGAAVKFRGVMVGSVERVGVAPDARHIDVTLRIDAALAGAIRPVGAQSQVRARAVMVGITGVKIIDLDVVDPAVEPAAPLPFEAPPNTIATAPTTLEGLERQLGALARQLPPMLEGLNQAVAALGQVVGEVRDQRVVSKVNAVVENAAAAASELRAVAGALSDAKLPEGLRRSLDGLGEGLSKLNRTLDRLSGDGGLIASAQRATDAFGDLGRATAASSTRLDTTLRDVDEAARAIRDLALELQQQPDMLVKGRARPRR